MRNNLVSIMALLVVLTSGITSAQAPGPTSQRYIPPRSEPADLPVTRADLAAAYLRFEENWRRYPPVASRLRELNRMFDGVAYLVIRNDFRGAIRMLNELADSLLPDGRASDQMRLLRSLRLRIKPTIVRLDAPAPLLATITPFYRVELPRPMPVRLLLRELDRDAAAPLQEIALRIDPQQPATTQPLALPDKPGRYVAELVADDGSTSASATLFVVDGSLDAVREENERAVAKLDDNPSLRQAVFAFRARNRLLTDRVFEGDSTSFLNDPISLAEDLRQELKTLQSGRDPYVGRIGDYWRAFLAGATSIPARIYAPRVADSRAPLPLVIALHGMGGDENMFMDGYGGGVMRRMADELGFILVTPSTYTVLPNAAAFDVLVDSIASLYAVDRSRVYLIGHSMGAMVAGSWASLYRDRVAAACLIAGGQIVGEGSAPALVIAGEFDSLFRVERLKGLAEAAKLRGLPVEFRVMLNYGHVLLVGDVVPEATRWMLAHRLATLTTRPATSPGTAPSVAPTTSPAVR
jgi:predicted esterase